MTLDLATIVRATGARVLHLEPDGMLVENQLRVADLNREFNAVVLDSREAAPGALFVALRGERTDGHAHVGVALQRGARGCLVVESLGTDVIAAHLRSAQQHESIWAPRYFFAVADPLRALHQLAMHFRDQHRAEVVGVTGSIGKTTTKEVVAGVLGSQWPVLKSEGNFNTEIGLPLMLLRLGAEHKVAVLEMGMYQPGDISLLADISRPRIGIVTNVAPIHLERMGTIERIARAKSELVASLPPDGLAVLNGDDPWTRAMARTSGVARTALVGFADDCDYRASDVATHGLEGVSFNVHADGRTIALRSRVPGAHTVHTFLAASATARELGMDWELIQEAVSNVELRVRQRIIRARDGLLIIDDSYNAAPLSMKAALELLGSTRGGRIAVLGDMLELGPQEEEAHHEVGRRAAEVADWLVVRGMRGRWIAEEAERHGLPRDHVVTTESNAEAARAVLDIVEGTTTAPTDRRRRRSGRSRPEWSVLVKGSRGMGMEEIVNELRGTR